MNPEDKRLVSLIYDKQRLVATALVAVAIVFFIRARSAGVILDPQKLANAKIIAIIFSVFACVEYFMAQFVFKKILDRQPRPSTPVEQSTRLKSAYIVRISQISGTNLIGTGLLIYFAITGVLSAQPLYWALLITYFLLIRAIKIWRPENSETSI